LTKTSDEALLELDGNVFIVEKKNGKEISRQVLDGNVVLKCLMYMLEQSIRQPIKTGQFGKVFSK
jgi:hypothetical protein